MMLTIYGGKERKVVAFEYGGGVADFVVVATGSSCGRSGYGGGSDGGRYFDGPIG